MVIDVVRATGASVTLATEKFATTNSATSATIGMTIPKVTTRPTDSDSSLPTIGRPSRRRRSHPMPSSATAPASTTQAATIIHHHRTEMSWEAGLSGSSVDWRPHPATKGANSLWEAMSAPPVRLRTGRRAARRLHRAGGDRVGDQALPAELLRSLGERQ